MMNRCRLKKIALLVIFCLGVLMVLCGVGAAIFFDYSMYQKKGSPPSQDEAFFPTLFGLGLAAWSWFELKLLADKPERK